LDGNRPNTITKSKRWTNSSWWPIAEFGHTKFNKNVIDARKFLTSSYTKRGEKLGRGSFTNKKSLSQK